eukprot:c11267_g1_i2.p1 GENE.c11267_g1_i2~~c11267_g1_i2.p1  ORF type:complete len:444 (-),score=115.92 c11267_g1_i2:190-1521(-)
MVALDSYLRELLIQLSDDTQVRPHSAQTPAATLITFLGQDLFHHVLNITNMKRSIRYPIVTVNLPGAHQETGIEGITCGDVRDEVLRRQGLESFGWKYALFAVLDEVTYNCPYPCILDDSYRIPDIPHALSTSQYVQGSGLRLWCLKVIMSPSYSSVLVTDHTAAPGQVVLGTASSMADPHSTITAAHKQDLVYEYNQAAHMVSRGIYPITHDTAISLAALHLVHTLTSRHPNTPIQHLIHTADSNDMLKAIYPTLPSATLQSLSKVDIVQRVCEQALSSSPAPEPSEPCVRYLALVFAANIRLYGCVFFPEVVLESVNGVMVIPSLVSNRDCDTQTCAPNAHNAPNAPNSPSVALGMGSAGQMLALPVSGRLGVRIDQVMLFGNQGRLLQSFPLRRFHDCVWSIEKVTLQGQDFVVQFSTSDAFNVSCCFERFLEIRRHFSS